MARKIKWSKRSQLDRKNIFSYWNKSNKSTIYSTKLNKLFIESAKFISEFPRTGRLTNRKNVRIKFVSHFSLIYEYSESELRILTIFDTRQDPRKLDRITGE